MDSIVSQLFNFNVAEVAGFSFKHFMFSLTLSCILASYIALIYRITHAGVSYSKSFTIVMVIMGMTISFIMLIIGSNLARAFSLVGALSVIRFRNAVKDSRDTAYIFMVMATGMACGTRLYSLAIVFVIACSIVLLIMHKFNFGSINREERLLQVKLPRNWDKIKPFEEEIAKLTSSQFKLLSKEYLNDEIVMLVYSVNLKLENINETTFDLLKTKFGPMDVRILMGFEKFNI